MTYLITGGAGFIGSAVARALIKQKRHVVVFDALTYAGTRTNLAEVEGDPHFTFVKGNICDTALVLATLKKYKVTKIMHLAAESHVDRSIHAPGQFIETNLVGTSSMLIAALEFYQNMEASCAAEFKFHHISTDEVFGDLGPQDPPFDEMTPYGPRSPYSASKAGSDFLVDAWHHTYGLPVVITNCSNNYGPYHFPEKLIPRTLIRALKGMDILVYGQGTNVRDWLYVEDHAEALIKVLQNGRVGERYAIGGNAERTNNEVVQAICHSLDRLRPRPDGKSYREQIAYVTDRAGHDRRYAINFQKIRDELGWRPKTNFEDGIARTIAWYLDNESWWRPLWLEGDSR